MANFNSSWGGYNNDADINSAAVAVPDPGGDLDVAIFRFPVAGRIRGAYAIPRATLAAGTSNFFSVGLVNGGVTGTSLGTVATAVGGTVGWTATTPKTISVTAGSETFAAGEWVVVDYNETGTVAPDLVIQIDYSLNPTS